MIFSLLLVDFEYDTPIIMANTILEDVFSLKFLGIHLIRSLTWNIHIEWFLLQFSLMHLSCEVFSQILP